MSIKPILLFKSMVLSILGGTKTFMRLPIRPQPDADHEFFGINCMDSAEFVCGNHCVEVDLPFIPGDIMQVHAVFGRTIEQTQTFLRVKNVWVQRLQDITGEDVMDEGILSPLYLTHRTGDELLLLDIRLIGEFAIEWNNSIPPCDYPSLGWESNPWVWVIEFEQYKKPD